MPNDVDNTDMTPDALRNLTDEQTERLSAVLDDYLARLESGDAPDREALLQKNPDIRDSLELYLGKLGELHNFAAGFSPHLAGIADGELPESDLLPSPNASIGTSTGTETDHGRNDSTQVPPLLQNSDTPGVSTKVLSGEFQADDGTPVGRKLDDFQLLRVIGRGGMGIVYEAQQISLKRRVAIKLLPLISVLDSRQITRFKNEAQAAASLQHPNIVPVYAVGNFRGVHYYAMRFIDGHPLDAIIATIRNFQLSSRGPIEPVGEHLISDADKATAADANIDATVMTEAQWTAPPAYQRVVKLGIQAANALAAAHEEGIIHRDIKPSNLMVDKKKQTVDH